jgi:hypothetical protein
LACALAVFVLHVALEVKMDLLRFALCDVGNQEQVVPQVAYLLVCVHVKAPRRHVQAFGLLQECVPLRDASNSKKRVPKAFDRLPAWESS